MPMSGSTICSTNQLEPGTIPPTKACLRKPDSNEKMVSSTSQSNEIQKQLEDTLFPQNPTKGENNQVSKHISSAGCNTIQENATPNANVKVVCMTTYNDTPCVNLHIVHVSLSNYGSIYIYLTISPSYPFIYLCT